MESGADPRHPVWEYVLLCCNLESGAVLIKRTVEVVMLEDQMRSMNRQRP